VWECEAPGGAPLTLSSASAWLWDASSSVPATLWSTGVRAVHGAIRSMNSVGRWLWSRGRSGDARIPARPSAQRWEPCLPPPDGNEGP
jgi:hypothetical protein